jgi:pyruvate,water dikinase
MELIRDFSKISKKDAALAGGKGASLGEMTQAGISVPPGFVLLADAFERFIEEANVRTDIDAVLHSVDQEKIHTVDEASEKIGAMILSAEMPEDIAKEIKKQFLKLGAKFVAVRSSATAEDSSSAAWAGQLDTYLNTTEETLLENVKKCWASLFTPRAIFYRFEKNLHNHKISVAVVVQKMVESEIAGIAFSVHPVTQDKNQLIIEAGFGLGEAVVSGQITPDSYVVEKKDWLLFDIQTSKQEKEIVKKPEGGNEWKPIPENRQEKQKLSGKQIIELAKLVVDIEQHYGFPCDIEWALKDGKFHITQSRPITTL